MRAVRTLAVGICTLTAAVLILGSSVSAQQLPPEGSQPPGSSISALSDTSCPDFKFCWWQYQDYQGYKVEVPVPNSDNQGSWVEFFGDSAKNRYGNRRVQFGNRVTGGNTNILGCLGPGDNNNNVWLNADVYRVGAKGNPC